MLRVVCCVLLLSLSEAAWAGSIVYNFGGTPLTRNTNANQDAKLDKLRVEENKRRAGQVPPLPPLSLEQYADSIMLDAFKTLNEQALTVETDNFCTSFATWTQAEKDQTIAKGGGNSPCP